MKTRTPSIPFASLAHALLLCTAFAQPALADRPVINIEHAGIQAYPVAIAPPVGEPTSGKAVLDVLSGDFTRSGLFRILDPASFLADPNKEGFTEQTIDFSKWTTVGASGLVKAKSVITGDNVQVEFHFYDTAKNAEVLHGTYSAPVASLRQIAHRFADDVMKFFTQERGDFQTRIAYVRETGDGKQIVVADSDGANAQAVTGASINLLPGWAHDGHTIAFTSFRDGAAHIYTVDALTRAIKPLVLMGDYASGPVFAPDGLRFTFSASLNGNTDIFLSEADGSAGRKLTEARDINTAATWSPDGKQIAFISNRAGNPQVYVMNADGSNQRRLTFQGNYNQEPAWSPKGDLIAFSGRDELRSFDIYTVAVATGKVARLTQNAGTNEKPSWSPNGRHLIFSSTRTGKRQLWTMSPDGTNQQRITDEPRSAGDPSWGPFPAGN